MPSSLLTIACCCLVIMDYSLAQRSITVDEDCVPFYTIHDIIMDYLKESISPERQVCPVQY